MNLVVASNNKHKIVEIKSILGSFFDEIYTLNDVDIHHETVEDGDTFYANASKKAREIYDLCKGKGYYVLADDSGLVCNGLNGEPGVYSARYSSEGTDEANRKLLLKNLAGKSDRSAQFVCCIVLITPSGEEITATGTVDGIITLEESGSNGFGYDPLFYTSVYGKTLAQVSEEEKNKISHRGNALRLLLDKIN